ncbi:MAG: hypothetical protein NTX48_05315 [Planctomycetales bacterium]|nr:hypothetical protein [Planctomycetales bacterium]
MHPIRAGWLPSPAGQSQPELLLEERPLLEELTFDELELEELVEEQLLHELSPEDDDDADFLHSQ